MTGPPTWTRRGVLTALLAAGAGCTTETDDSTTSTQEPSDPETPTDEPSERSTTSAPTPTETATTTEESTATDEPTTEEPTTTAESMEEITDVAFRETPQRTLRLDLYLPSTEEASPFVVYAHGGGWIGGDKGHRPMFDRLVEKGFAVADIQYRLAQEKQYPAAVRDVVAAVKWVRANAGEYGIDSDRGALMGYSAGAHLAALVAVAPDHENFQPDEFHPDVPVGVDALVGYSGPYDFTDSGIGENPLVAAFFGADAPMERLEEGSPVSHVEGDDPPALLIHGTDDNVVPHRSTTALADAYRNAGVPVEVLTGDGVGHGMIDNDEWREETLPSQEQFLADHLDST